MKSIPRAIVNVAVLRGRRRTTRVLLLLGVAALMSLVAFRGRCLLGPSYCEAGAGEEGFFGALGRNIKGRIENSPLLLGNGEGAAEEKKGNVIVNGEGDGPDKEGAEEGGKLPASLTHVVNSEEVPQRVDNPAMNSDPGGVAPVAGKSASDSPQAVSLGAGPAEVLAGQPVLDGGKEAGQVAPQPPQVPQEQPNVQSLGPNLQQLVPRLPVGARPPQVPQEQPNVQQLVPHLPVGARPPQTLLGQRQLFRTSAPGAQALPTLPTAADDEGKMSAAKVAAAIKSGEMCKSVCPPFVWSAWSPCSKACGRGRRYRKAIYDFVCQASHHCPINRIDEAICETPCRFDPDKYGGKGGLDMYPISPLNPPIYPEDKDYMCGSWLIEYTKIHEDILAGRRDPAFLVYSTGRGDYPTAGGIAGRLRGITTTFFMAVLLDRAFLIDWTDPPGLGDYLQPKSFNWADLTAMEQHKRGPVRDVGSWRSYKESGKTSQWYMDSDLTSFFTYPVEVIQGHRYDFTYAVLRNPVLMPKAFELGVDQIKCRICCAFDMLFKQTEKFSQEMDGLLKTLGRPVRPLVAIPLRAKVSNVQSAVAMAEVYVKCAMKATKALKLANSQLVPLFNNRLVTHIVTKKYSSLLRNPIMIESATRTVHSHLGNLPYDTEVEVAKGVQERTFKEFFLAMNSTLLIRSKGYASSFGNVADAIRRHYGLNGNFWTYTVGEGASCEQFPTEMRIE